MRFKKFILEQVCTIICSREKVKDLLTEQEKQELKDLQKVADFLRHGIPIDD